MEEEIIGVLVVKVGFALANLVHSDRLKRDRLKVFSLKRDMRDSAFPVDRFVGGPVREQDLPGVGAVRVDRLR